MNCIYSGVIHLFSFTFVQLRQCDMHACSHASYVCVRMYEEKFKLKNKKENKFRDHGKNCISQNIRWLKFLSLLNGNKISNVNENRLKEIISWNDQSRSYVSSIVLFIHCAWAATLYGKYVNWKAFFGSIAVAYIVAFFCCYSNATNQWA